MVGGLVLGPVVFQGFEVPARVRFGGKQRLAVHLLPGGGRVVDVMGADEAPLVWSGVFYGPEAGERVRVLERLRRDGVALPLSWQGWRYTVVIESIRADSMNPAWIPYQLKVVVVSVGDVAVDETDPAAWGSDDAEALGAGPTLDADIGTATADLQATDVAVAIGAAGSLARLVAARAFLGEAFTGSL